MTVDLDLDHDEEDPTFEEDSFPVESKREIVMHTYILNHST